MEPDHFDELVKLGLAKERLLWILRKMVEIRKFEEKVEELFLVKGMLIGPSHLYLGQEAIAVGVIAALDDSDLITTTYRGHGHAIAKDVPMRMLMAELFGKSTGTCMGLGGSMHVAIFPQKGSVYATAIVGSGIPIAVGMALALKLKKSGQLVATFFGDGAVNTGAFHEAMNLAALWRLPLILVCENNQYAMSTRVDRAVSSKTIAERAASYNMQSVSVDGNNIEEVYLETEKAAQKVRQGFGPVFLECRTYKLKGHGVYDKAEYRPKDEVAAWAFRDPINRFRDILKSKGMATEKEMSRIDAEVEATVADSVKFSQDSPLLPFKDLAHYVYS